MMKLRYSPTSPYVRKVAAMVIECGLSDRVERVLTDPWASRDDHLTDNPLSKVPTLIVNGGSDYHNILFDSPVICEFLDSLHAGHQLFPDAGPARWDALKLQAMGDALCDAAINRRLDKMRPKDQQSHDWQKRQDHAIARTVTVLEGMVGDFPEEVTIGTLSVGVGLGYLDLRWDDGNWRDGHPKLAAWYEDFAKRPSMVETAPPPA